MMQQPALMQRAQERSAPANDPAILGNSQDAATESGAFAKPDLSKVTPPEMRDTVDRIVAAGMKIMYSPDMRKELAAEIERDVPMPQKLAEGVVGLVLTLDKKTKGGLPMAAIFPAELELLSEAAEVVQAAGQDVTQQDFNDAAMMMSVLTAKKMGAKDDEIMGAAQQWVGAHEEQVPGEQVPGPAQQPAPLEEPMRRA